MSAAEKKGAADVVMKQYVGKAGLLRLFCRRAPLRTLLPGLSSESFFDIVFRSSLMKFSVVRAIKTKKECSLCLEQNSNFSIEK